MLDPFLFKRFMESFELFLVSCFWFLVDFKVNFQQTERPEMLIQLTQMQ